MKKGCSLCGGKLKNGICTECGMDNRKSDEIYSNVWNQGQCQEKKLTHIHREKEHEEKSLKEKRQAKKYGKTHGSEKAFRQQDGKDTYKEQKKKEIPAFVAGMVLIGGVFLFQAISDEPQDREAAEYISDDLSEGTELLKKTGEKWNSELGAGMYVVGYDIPEGIYTLEGEKGTGFVVYNSQYGDSVTKRFGTEEYQISSAKGIRLFEGALVMLEGMGTVSFSAEDANLEDMNGKTENPLTEKVEISGEAVAGQDFSPGIYDVTAMGEGFGILGWELPPREGEETGTALSVLMEENPTQEYPEYTSEYKNLALVEGTKIKADEISVRLIPSQQIPSEDYGVFYENLY